MNLMQYSTLAVLLFSSPISAEPKNQYNNLEKLGFALDSGDVYNVKNILNEDVEIISYFDGKFRKENIDTLFSNFSGRKKIEKSSNKNVISYDVCDGVTSFVIQMREVDGKITQVVYGTSGFSPPPIPYSMRNGVDRCKPPIRIISGF